MDMDSSRVKYSGGKLVSHSDLRAETARGSSWKKNLKVATWNVRSMFEGGALRTITKEANTYKLDIVALQETGWPDEGQIAAENFIFFYGGRTRHTVGTGFLINKNIISAIRDIKFVSDRLSYVIMQGRWQKIILINVHAHTEDKDDDVKDEFYDQLERLYDNFSSFDVKLIIGDFNAKIGKEEVFYPTIGKESLHGDSNDNGVRVINFAASKNLIVKSTCFKHKNIHKGTWKSPDGTTCNQIDHLLIDKRHHTNILDVRTYRAAECKSDHYLVVSKFRMRLSTTENKQVTTSTKKFAVEKLKEANERLEYQVEVSNRFEVLGNSQNTDDPESLWSEIKYGLKECAEKTIGIRKRNGNKPWFDKECEKKLSERREANLLTLSDNNNNSVHTENYQRICKETSRLFRNKKREWQKNRIANIQSNFRENNTRDAFKGINAIRKGFQSRSNMMRDAKGDLVADTNGLLETWKKYFDKLLNVHGNSAQENCNEIHTAEPLVEVPTFEEVYNAIQKLKNNKAPGIDGLTSELYKYGGVALTAKIQQLIAIIWDKETLPKEWNESIIIPIFKKGDKTDCNNYRGISLLSTCYKIFSTVLLNRLTPYAEEIVGDYQCGFRRNRSTTDQIFTIRQLLEKKWEYMEPVYQLFVDFKKAYDSIKRTKMYEVLAILGIPKKLIKLIQISLTENFGRVRVGNNISEPFEIHNGLKQGDAISPLLFNLVLEYVMRAVFEREQGATLNGIIQALAFADDIDLVADEEETLVRNAETLINAAKEVGLEISEDKTKCMITSRLPIERKSELKINNLTFKTVKEFKYLGTIITEENEMDIEIKKRLHAGNACLYAANTMLRSRLLSRKTKIRIYKTIIQPVVLYGCVTWSLTKKNENKLRVFENKVLRKIFGARKDEIDGEYRKLHNFELDELYNSPNIVRVVKARKLQWAGHVARMDNDRMAHRVFLGKPKSRRPLGRPRRRWEDNIKFDLREIGYADTHRPWTEIAKNREDWRSCVEAAMNFRVQNAK